jgi:hypothetical protein
VKLFGVAQAGFNRLDLTLGCGNSLFRFLLKCMEHINRACKADGVDRPKGSTIEIIDYLKDGTTAESLERFSRNRLAIALNLMQRVPMFRRTGGGNPKRSLRLEPTKMQGLGAVGLMLTCSNMELSPYHVNDADNQPAFPCHFPPLRLERRHVRGPRTPGGLLRRENGPHCGL